MHSSIADTRVATGVPPARRYGSAMSAPQVFLGHLEHDARPANEIRVLIETAIPGAAVRGPKESLAGSDIVLLLYGGDAATAAPLHDALQMARDADLPIIPIVHDGQTLEGLRPTAPIERGVEFHDQMFAIKLLLVIQEALGGERLLARGAVKRA